MLEGKITFDRFIRGVLVASGFAIMYCLISSLSGVLWPFFVAWILAYMMYPLVIFLENKCHLHFRAISILVALLISLGIIIGLLFLTIPPIVREIQNFSDDIVDIATQYLGNSDLSREVELFFNDFDGNQVVSLLQQYDFTDAIQMAATQLWSLISGTIGVLMAIFNFFIMLLYLFFILMDYEKISSGWCYLIPKSRRTLAQQVVEDVKNGMNAYFRGQGLVAFSVGVLFSIGFLIIDFPMAIGLGLFIGLLNMIPYMQLVGFVPAFMLAYLKASETGQSFWGIALCVLIVFCVVQLIQDTILVPRIMGKVMGLNPAIILLSLSVWGSLLGIIGVIIALPLTTLMWSYYRRYIVKE